MRLSPASPRDAEEARRRSYVAYHFRPNCGPRKDDDRTLADSQAEELYGIADRLHAELTPLDRAIAQMRRSDEATSPPGGFEELDNLRRQRDSVVREAILALSREIDPMSAEKVRRHVLEHVRAHIKMTSFRIER